MSQYRQGQPNSGQTAGERIFGLDFGKYLLSSSHQYKMESDNTGESDVSDWEHQHRGVTSDFSEDSDEYGIYYGDGMFDTAIDDGTQQRLMSQREDRQTNRQMRKIITQLNAPNYDPGLYPIRETGGSVIMESSGSATNNEDDEDEENLDDVVSNTGSPLHKPVYGRYQKLSSQGEEYFEGDDSSLEKLMLHRLPGENLGMTLGIEGGKDRGTTVTSVTVKSVTLGGAAYRASGGSKGVCAGDEIVDVNGQSLLTLSHDESILIFKDMPLQVMLGVRRGKKNLPPVSVSPLPLKQHEIVEKRPRLQQQPARKLRRQDLSDSEEESYGGFAVYQVAVDKEPDENLGLSIVPSYGSTKEYYQIKRILPSGAAAQSGQLCVGDRLILCNGTSLRGLPQSRCLAIIRSASSEGRVSFEVIRPVYNASSMEISVTLNNNTNGRLPGFDPRQYSLKSQSYDRNVDVIVTSESEDYLTVSDDDYSRKRLGNIPAVEANEVFATNSVKLAYQKPISTIVEESTESETDPENTPVEGTDSDTGLIQKSRLTSPIPHTDLDNISIGSGRRSLPKTDLDTVSVRTNSPVSPRSPVSPSPYRGDNSYQKRQQVPSDESGRTVSPPPEVLEEDFPVTSIDDLNSTKYNPLYSDSNASEQASDVEQGLDVYVQSQSPYDSASESQRVPFTDLDNIDNRAPAVRAVPRSEIDSVADDSDDTVEAEEALPPPVEFSDNQFDEPSEDDIYIDKNDQNSVYFPVTNIDDIHSVGPYSEEGSPDHKVKKGFQTRIHVESDLAFNSELTAPFDSVIQEHIDSVQNGEDSLEVTDSSDGDVLKGASGYESEDIVIAQFEPLSEIKKTTSPNYKSAPHRTVISIDTTMDKKSETMLKDALDMEYDQMPDSNKMQTRVELGAKVNGEECDFESPDFDNKNVAAEMIAKDMVGNENGNYGYYMESDDEPDQFPTEDGPEEAPDLPMSPPPMMDIPSNGVEKMPFSNSMESPRDNEYNHITERSEELLVEDSNWSFKSKDQEPQSSSTNDSEIVPVTKARNVNIPINILEAKHAQNSPSDEGIVAVKVHRNFELPPSFKKVDIVERQVTAPDAEVIEESKSVLTKTPKSSKKIPPTVAPKPKKNVTKVTEQPGEEEAPPVEEVMEAVVVDKDPAKNIVNVISVVNALKSKAKDQDPDVVDVITKQEKVRDTMASFAKINGKEDVIPKLLPETSPPKHEQIVSESDKIKMNIKTEPSVTVTTSMKKTSPRESPPVAPKPRQTTLSPRQDDSKSMKEVDSKVAPDTEEAPPPIPTAPIPQKIQEPTGTFTARPVLSPREAPKPAPRASPRSPASEPPANTPVMKTSITVAKPEPSSDKAQDTSSVSPPVKKESPSVKKESPSVPPLNLSAVTKDEPKSPVEEQKTNSISPKSATYKTTIGVKPVSFPASTIKPLSQIKPLSFNPKSLSQTMKPLQYKTSIAATGLSSTLGRPSLSSSLKSQKVDHPIKRMETMPFEVSILKGILGLGIKTTMTQDGLVEVTEILPSGPVGREGNIKVGDYLLSINNTSLIGLTDNKVQQILRLLPRGLSKIVASPVKPDSTEGGSSTAVTDASHITSTSAAVAPAPVKEKQKLSPRQSAPLLSSSKQPTVIPTPKPPTFAAPPKWEVKPIITASTKSVSPQASPRSPTDDPSDVVHAEVTAPAETHNPTSQSPLSSPRQQTSSPKISPRTPPQVAPKPKRPARAEPTKETPVDPSEPIETEIFVSVNASKDSSSPQVNGGSQVLPGAVSYDSVEVVNKTGWTPGIVSSSDIKAKDMVLGKTDVVEESMDSCSPVTCENTVKSPFNEEDVSELPDQTDNFEATVVEKTEAVVENQSELPEDVDSGVSESLYANRSRTFSTSSSHSSYADFQECNVEDELIPEQIVEEEESPNIKTEPPVKDNNATIKDDDYESDFEDENNPAREECEESVVKPPSDDLPQENVEAVRQIAENIVSSVISSVMEMDLSQGAAMKDDSEGNEVQESEVSSEVEPQVQTVIASPECETPPPLPDFAPPTPPPTPTEGPTPATFDLPAVITEEQLTAKSVTAEESSKPAQQTLPVPVVDMNLYPDDSPDDSNDASVEAIDIDVAQVDVNVAQTVSMHESVPNDILVFEDQSLTNNDTNFAIEQVIDSTNSQSGDADLQESMQSQVEVNSGSDDQGYSAVLSMYSDLERSLGPDDVNNPVKIIVPNDSNSNDVKDESNVPEQSEISHDIKQAVKDTHDAKAPEKDLDKNANETKKIKIEEENQEVFSEDKIPSKVNDDSVFDDSTPAKPANLKLTESSHSDVQTEEVATPSPRRVDDILEELKQSSPVGKYSPETERMIRVMSVDEEPAKDGEGEIIHVNFTKGVTGLGFVIQGGKMSPRGDLPISIKRIFKGGPADGLLQARDEIIEVDGEALCEMRHSEAWNHLKFLPSGQISMKIRRHESSA